MNPSHTAPAPAASAWTLGLRSGLCLQVPPGLDSLSSYVLLEQESWFEPEMSLMPLLLQPGMDVLDIGANHGVYALEMARCTGSGRVWAFEPTSAPRCRLQASVRLNGMEDRVTVVDAALAECDGQASFAVGDNSELNSREGAGEQRETVRLLALDGYLDQRAPGVEIAFVKLDAEGDELRVLAGGQRFFALQRPVVMFEFKHGRQVNHALLRAWADLGYEIFRWSAELALLLPFDAGRDETAFALNLLAIHPQAQPALQARGLLARPDAAAEATAPVLDPTRLAAWCAQPALQGLGGPESAGDDYYQDLLLRVACCHLQPDLNPQQRLRLMRGVRDELVAAAEDGAHFGPAAWAMLVHAQMALGEQRAAVQLASRLLSRWPRSVEIDMPFVAPLRADLQRCRSSAAGSWLRQTLAEFVERHASFSSYFARPEPASLAALLAHPDHSVEMERRYLLAHARADRTADLSALRWLPAPRHTANPALWKALLASFRQLELEAA